MTTAESLEIAAAIRSGDIFNLPRKKLEQFTVLLASSDAYTHYGASEYPRICETVKMALQARISEDQNKQPNDKRLKLQNLITEIENQSIKFDSDNWPRLQKVCVEWGDKVAPFLSPEEKRIFNNELQYIRADMPKPGVLDYIDFFAFKKNSFDKMMSLAKQKLNELELNPSQNENSMDALDLPSKVTVSWMFTLFKRMSFGTFTSVLAFILGVFGAGVWVGQSVWYHDLTARQSQPNNSLTATIQSRYTAPRKVNITPAPTKKDAIQR
jgi:hypothetical protein